MVNSSIVIYYLYDLKGLNIMGVVEIGVEKLCWLFLIIGILIGSIIGYATGKGGRL